MRFQCKVAKLPFNFKNFFPVLFIILFHSGLIFGQSSSSIQLPSLDTVKTENFFSMRKNINDYFVAEQKVNNIPTANSAVNKIPNWNLFKRWEYYWEQRTNPETGEFAKTNAILEYNKSLNENPKAAGFNENWINLGTNTSAGGYAGLGRINCIAFHPTDNNTFWVGSPSGGIWKTTNRGNSWVILNNNQSVLGVSDIVLANDFITSNTMYIVTGDRDGGSIWSLGGGQGADNASVGILKSNDGGNTWTTTGLSYTPSAKKMVYRLLMHPTNSQMLITATTDGLMKSTDGGNTWTSKNSNKFIDLEFKPGDPSIVYASTVGYGNAYVFRSTNSGDSWSSMVTVAGGRRSELAVTPANPSIVYQLIANSTGGVLAIYKSTDSGASFFQVSTNAAANPGMLGYYSDGSGAATGQGSYDLCIAASPSDANVVFIGGVTTWKSTDGGANWAINNMWTASTAYNFVHAPEVHADKHVLSYQNASNLFEGNDGGIYVSTNSGTSWTDLSNGLIISQIYRIGISKTDASKVLAGLQDNGTKKYNGAINTWSDVYGGDGMECAIDNNNATSYMYVTYTNGQIYRSSNGFSTSSTVKISDNIPGKPSGAWVTPYIIDPTNSTILFAGYDKVWKTVDRGNNWVAASQQLSATTKLRSIAVAPTNTNVIYAADLTNLWKTTDGGATNWTPVTLPVSSNSVTYISVKANDPNTLWITYGGFTNGVKIFQSIDGGTSWTNISGGLPNLPAMSIVQYKRALDRYILFAGTDVGVYVKDGNTDWAALNTGLPNVVVPELEIFYGAVTDKLRAATFGRGLWETEISVPATTVGIPVLVSPVNSAIQVSIQPTLTWNKVAGVTDYTIQLSTDSTFTDVLFNLNIADTIYQSTVLSNSTKYFWRVMAQGGTFSAVNSFTTCFPVIPILNYPINNAIVYTLTPTLHWNLNQYFSGVKFDVLLSTDSLFTMGNTTILEADSATQLTLNTLLPTTHYFWKVKSKTATGSIFSFSARQDFTTFGVLVSPTPSWPVGGAVVYTNNPTLYWYMGTAAYTYSYEIRYKESAASVWSAPQPVGSNLYQQLPGLSPATSYDWAVRSSNGTSNSDWSSTQSFVTYNSGGTAPPQPILSYPNSGVTVYTNSPLLYWYINSSTAGLDYSVQVSKNSNFSSPVIDYQAISNLYVQLNSLDPGCMYYWRVKSHNGAAWSSWSLTDSFYTFNISGNLKPVLTYPVGGTTVYSTTPVLYWYTLGGISGLQYEVQYAQDVPVFSQTLISSTTSFTLPALQYGGKYFWRIRSKQGTVTSEWSSIDSFEVTGKAGSLTPILTWPVGGALSSTSPTFYWYVNSYLTGVIFYLEYADNEEFTAATVISSNTYSVTLSGLTTGTLYYWRVRAFNGSQYSPYSAVAQFTTTSGSTPGRPLCGSPTAGVVIGNNSPVFSWFLPSPGSNVKYELQYSNTPDFISSVSVVNISTTSYLAGNFTSTLPVYWRIRSKSTEGVYSRYSEIAHFIPQDPNSNKRQPEVATLYELLQNYPNPFNPTTVIDFVVPELSRVRISIYNQLGEKITDLVDASFSSGRHSLVWNAAGNPSGLYLCEMQTEKMRSFKKLILLK